MTMYTCPVCGYNELDEPPARHIICPCCGTQFGLDDRSATYRELRLIWLTANARPTWFSDYTRPPSDWDWRSQVAKVDDEPVRFGSDSPVEESESPFVIDAGLLRAAARRHGLRIDFEAVAA